MGDYNLNSARNRINNSTGPRHGTVYLVASNEAPLDVQRAADAICNGLDDQEEIQAALNLGYSVRLVGQKVRAGVLVPATFSLGASLVLKFPGQRLEGQGLDATVLKLQNSVNDYAVKTAVPSGQTYLWGAQVRDLTIDANMANQTDGGGIALDRVYFGRLENLRILNTKAMAIRLYRGGGGASDYCAYTKLVSVSASVGDGHGIVLDAGSEFNELHGCNASFFQGGTVVTNYFDEPATDAGIGLFLKGGNNLVMGGHFDRCRIPMYLEFSHGNRIISGTDNALDCAVAVKGSQRNTLTLEIGRCDPQVAGGQPLGGSSKYGTRRAVNIVNNTSANDFASVVFHPDNAPPSNPPGTSGQGGWRFGIGGSSGEGAVAQGGRNLLRSVVPSNVAIRLDGNSSPVKSKSANYQMTTDDLGFLGFGGDTVLLGDATAGAITLTLPDLGALQADAYRVVTVKNIGSANNVTVAAFSGDSIAGGSIALTPGQSARVMGSQGVANAPTVWQKIG